MRKLTFILIIYATFISLGLPDSLLGVAWPNMVGEFHVAHSAAGVTVLPPLLGVLLQNFSMNLFPIFLVIYALILLGATIAIEKGRTVMVVMNNQR